MGEVEVSGNTSSREPYYLWIIIKGTWGRVCMRHLLRRTRSTHRSEGTRMNFHDTTWPIEHVSWEESFSVHQGCRGGNVAQVIDGTEVEVFVCQTHGVRVVVDAEPDHACCMVEVEMSDCPSGCKWHWCRKCHVRELIHNPTYGANHTSPLIQGLRSLLAL